VMDYERMVGGTLDEQQEGSRRAATCGAESAAKGASRTADSADADGTQISPVDETSRRW
jgi:hypothetical protein